MKRFQSFARRVSLTVCLALCLCVAALAEDPATTQAASVDISGVTDALTTGITGLVPTILTAVGALAVAGLAIFGAKFAVRAGLAMFRQVTGRN